MDIQWATPLIPSPGNRKRLTWHFLLCPLIRTCAARFPQMARWVAGQEEFQEKQGRWCHLGEAGAEGRWEDKAAEEGSPAMAGTSASSVLNKAPL